MGSPETDVDGDAFADLGRDGLFDAGRGVHAHLLDARGHERRRPAGPDLGAHLGEQLDVRPQHAAVEQVAEDAHLEPADAPLAETLGELGLRHGVASAHLAARVLLRQYLGAPDKGDELFGFARLRG